jgi:hypothetical protein
MSYQQTPKSSSSLSGVFFLLFLVMAGLTLAVVSTSMAGPPKRQVTVVLPVGSTHQDQKK